jgi:hypothetical protein
MPIEECQRNGEKGWRWPGGKCYLPSEEGSVEAAKNKARQQGIAISIRKHMEEQEK